MVRVSGGLPRQAWLAIVIALVALAFAVSTPAFRSNQAIFAILGAFTQLAMLALGQSLVMAAGGVDLSIGSTYGLALMIVGALQYAGYTDEVTLVAGLGAGLVVGVTNGLLVTKLRFMSFIATFGTLAIVRAGAYLIHYGPLAGTQLSITGMWIDVATGHSLLWVPPRFLILIGLALVVWFLLSRTSFGLWCYATGGNLNAARAAGIPVDRVRMVTYVVAGLLAALAGMIGGGALGGARPYAGGGMELMSIAAVIIGGTSLAGGSASILGAMLTVLLFTLGSRGLAIMGVAPHFNDIANGLIVIGALVVAGLSLRRGVAGKEATGIRGG